MIKLLSKILLFSYPTYLILAVLILIPLLFFRDGITGVMDSVLGGDLTYKRFKINKELIND